MKKLWTPFTLGLATAVLVIGLGLAAGIAKVHAIGNSGPVTTTDGVSDYGGANVYYTLQYNDNIKAYRLDIPVYTPTAPPKGSSVTINVTYSANDAPLYFLDNTSDSLTGNRPSSFNIPAASFSLDAGSGYYKALITGCLQAQTSCSPPSGSLDTKVDFRLSAPADDLIGYSSNNDATTFTIRNDNRCDGGGDQSGCDKYYDYSLPFANTCAAASTAATIQIYDADNPSPIKSNIGTQPKAFTYDLVKQTATGFVSVKSTVTESGSWTTSNASRYLKFTAQKGAKYKLLLKGVYTNNILQFKLPFDSINYSVPCTSGQLQTSGSADGCTQLTGWAYDPADTSTAVYYYLAANQSTAQTNYADTTAFYAKINVPASMRGTANRASPTTNPGGLSGHGFLAALNTSTPDWNGTWAANDYALYVREPNTNTVKLLDTFHRDACSSLTCGTAPNYSVGAVGQPVSFNVRMNTTNASGTPPGATFAIKVVGPDGTRSLNGGNGTYASNVITSSTVSFTPTTAGNYVMTWSYNGTGCGPITDTAGFEPYVSVVGGDVSAGAGFGTGCTDDANAGITTFNTNNADGSGTYKGSSSTLGAIAMKPITGFATGTDSLLGTSTANNTVALPKGLAFSNTPAIAGAAGGNFNNVGCVPDYAADAAQSADYEDDDSTGVDVGDPAMASGIYQYNDTGDSHPFVINASAAIQAGKQITIVVYHDAVITSDIKYDTGYGTVTNAPRLNIIIYGGALYIAGKTATTDVQTLDGFYAAQPNGGRGGNIFTCAEPQALPADPLVYVESTDVNNCGNKLTVNGALSAGSIYLDRTYGNIGTAGAGAGAAETINFSPELWASSLQSCSADISTCGPVTSISSLPPVL